MINKKKFQKQVSATKSSEDLAVLIKTTSRTICKEELLAEISVIKSNTDVLELIRKVNNFNDEDVAEAFSDKIISFAASLKDHQKVLSLKTYFVDPVLSPITYWEIEQYSMVKISITKQLLITSDSLDEMEKILDDSTQVVYDRVIDVYWERRHFLEKN